MKRKIIKTVIFSLAGILAALVIFTLAVFLLLKGASNNGDKTNGVDDYSENIRRSSLAISLKMDAEGYYKHYKHYPSVSALYSSKNLVLTDYLKEGVISYSVKKDNFCVRYIDSDQRFQSPDQKYSMSWNGKQYCSNKEDLIGFSESWQADGAGFYIYDLH